MNRTNTGGTVAIIITIVVVGGLVYLGLSGGNSAQSGAASSGDMAGHHVGKTGPTADPNALIGKPAPDFTLQDRNGTSYALKDLRGKKVILFFNEGVMCYPACWDQVAALGKDTRFKDENTVALSIVVDSPAQWNSAVKEMPELAAGTVLHDITTSMSSSYGMLTTASSMHYGQLPGHTYVVIDADGVIRHVYDDPTMSIHNDQLLEEIKRLDSSS